jgi:hypothetical protein
MTQPQHTHRERIIFFHKHGTSARTRFLRFAEHTICGYAPLPKLSQIMENSSTVPEQVVETHPAVLLKEAAQRLQLPPTAIMLEADYNMWVETPDVPVRILLARFTDIDPPLAAVTTIDARFIDLTEARDLPAVELLLLRKAYEVILGG